MAPRSLASTDIASLPADPPDWTSAEAAVHRLIRMMRLRWQSGERPLAEELLAQCPELPADAEDILDLLYEEYCLREQFGVEVSLEIIANRFPRWSEGLANLIAFHRLIDEGLALPRFPEAGERFGDFHLIARLGEGRKGRVLVARQASLGYRPVVLKLTPMDGREHLSLARLQHTHIVPLHASSIDRERRLRLLCMPYFGGATLLQVLRHLAAIPVRQRNGRDLVAALDSMPAAIPYTTTGREPGRLLLASLSYVKAVCYLGSCLADALHYAHQRGLLHLDLKPSNVLLSADGEPMLLDFHLAHEPLPAGARPVEDIGGTALYMPPEQHQALQAVRDGVPLPASLGQGADVFGLGAMLSEMLGGELPHEPGVSPPLHALNPRVGRGLSDLIERTLSARQEDRQGTAELAEDLRRHLNNQPLLSVPNRSWRERWRKWRQRHPAALRFWMLGFAVLFATLAAGFAVWLYVDHHIEEGELALREGHQKAAAHHHEEAIATFQRGLDHLGRLPFPLEMSDQLRQGLVQTEQAFVQARRVLLRADLHRTAEQLRGLYGVEVSLAVRAPLQENCRILWARRHSMAEELEVQRDPAAVTDFLDIALLWAEWQPDSQRALQVLTEAETLFGSNLVLDFERQRFRGGSPPELPVSAQPATAWEYHALGRGYFCAGQLARAEEYLEKAIALRLDDRWSHFLLGLCAHRRRRHQDAVTAFTFCLGASPDAAACSYNRGLAYYSLKEYRRARADYDRALQLGAPAVPVHFNLALVAIAQDDHRAARQHLRRVLESNSTHEEARKLLNQLPAER